MTQPTDLEQFMLELVNDARLNPMGDAARYLSGYAPLTSTDPLIQQAITQFGVNGAALQSIYTSLVAASPLAWNDSLGTAAQNHSQAQITAQEQSHQVAGELGLGARLTAAGYTGWTTAGENVYAYAHSVLHGHAGFMIDWGTGTNGMQDPAKHRLAIMSATYTEIGIDVTAESTTANPLGPFVITQDLASRNKVFVLGVAYNDSDDSNFYSVGEGRSDLVISSGGTTMTSGAAGGYSLEVTTGPRTITLAGGGLLGSVTVTTEIASNLKLDVVDGTKLFTSGSVTAAGAFTELRGLGVNSLSLSSGDGNQLLAGSSGSDLLFGGAGTDIAQFTGNSTSYKFDGLAVDMFVSGGNDGRDRLTYIEILRFADGDFTWSPTGGLQAYTGPNPIDPTNPPTVPTDPGKIYLRGNVFTDYDDNLAVSTGEAVSGLLVSRTGASTSSGANGDYALEIRPGIQTVALVGGKLAGPVTVTGEMNGNTTLNVVNGDTLYSSASIAVSGPIVALRGLGTTGLSLTAGDGNQVLSGTIGNDILFGGAGTDVAEFTGKSTSYKFSGLAADIFVTPGTEEKDRLIYVEVLRFSDGDFTWTPAGGLKKYTGTAVRPSDPVKPVDPVPPVDPVDPVPPVDPVDPGNPSNPDAGTGGFGRLFLIPGSQTYGPVPGGDLTEIVGSNQAERITLAADVDAVFDPSFVRGNDTAVVLGNAGNYNISSTVAGISIAASNGASVRIPAFGTGGGLTLIFNNGTFHLGTDDGGSSFQLTGTTGVLDIGGTAVAIGTVTPGGASGTGGTGATDPYSLDVGTATVARTLDAGTGNITFHDNAEATGNVRITGMASGDSIVVTNAVASDYNFQRDFQDTNDLVITYTDTHTGATNRIVLDEVLPVSGAVGSLALATATVGYTFMTFA